MADFYPVLSRAIARLTQQTPEARRAIYDRAAEVLVAQLRSVVPPMTEADIDRQRMQLDDVIARIEREQQPPVLDFPETVDDAAVERSDAEADPAIDAQAGCSPAGTRDASWPDEARAFAEPGDEPSARPVPAFAGATRPAVRPGSDHAANGRASAGQAEFERPDDGAQPEAGMQPGRPRLDISAAPPKSTGGMRKAIVAGGVLLGVAAIAATAYYVNREDLSPPPTAQAPAARAAPQPDGAKITARAGAENAPPAAPAQSPAGPPGAATPQRQDIAVAQRAVLYVEPADASQPPRAIVGRVSWRVEAQNAGQGQQLETVIRADVEIAESGLNLVFTIRRNTDPAFPASHILGIRFQRVSDDGNGAVKEAGVPQLKAEENERGAPLSAITSILAENLFVSALSRVPVEVERNVDLIRNRNWIDIPVRFASGKRGIIAFEKGLSGDQRIAEGFRSWQ